MSFEALRRGMIRGDLCPLTTAPDSRDGLTPLEAARDGPERLRAPAQPGRPDAARSAAENGSTERRRSRTDRAVGYTTAQVLKTCWATGPVPLRGQTTCGIGPPTPRNASCRRGCVGTAS